MLPLHAKRGGQGWILVKPPSTHPKMKTFPKRTEEKKQEKRGKVKIANMCFVALRN